MVRVKILPIISNSYTPNSTSRIENTKLKNEIRNLKSTLSVAEGSSGQTNLDILRRLGELEKIVYGEE